MQGGDHEHTGAALAAGGRGEASLAQLTIKVPVIVGPVFSEQVIAVAELVTIPAGGDQQGDQDAH